jgi:hypothetical protein
MVGAVPAMYPTAEGFHDRTDERRDRFTTGEWAGIDSFPFRSTELCLLAVSDRTLHRATPRQLALFGFPAPGQVGQRT